MQIAGPNDSAADPVMIALIHGGCQMRIAGAMLVQPVNHSGINPGGCETQSDGSMIAQPVW